MDMLALIVGLLIVVWYFGLVRSARRISNAADTKAGEIELAALAQFQAKYDETKIAELKKTKDLLNSF